MNPREASPLASSPTPLPGPEMLRGLADQAFSRAAGAPLVLGNRVRVLKDAAEHCPAWLNAIRAAQRSIFLECYIFSFDEVGQEFVAALAERARAGVSVRVIYDWLGTRRGGRLFAPLVAAGGEVRCFNPPGLASPFGWFTRDHRKMLAVDGRIGFVTGLCVSARWLGDPSRRVEPWRDTGVEIHGPAVPLLERAFAQVWDETGEALPARACTPQDTVAPEGDVALRVIASVPSSAGVFRLDQLVAAGARRRLWLTDAYFVAVTPYVQALCAAARDGTDVRLLVPGASDLPVVSRLSRASYRPSRRVEPWRDTGVEIHGPAVPLLERAFAQVWDETGEALPARACTPQDTVAPEGDVALRVIASVPSSAGVFRLDQLVAAGARRRLWLTDAYFVAVTPYVQALCAAARDGTDVRLLVPGASDLPVVSRLSRASYRPLLDAGVRVFEWNGTMLHAKTAVADESWARVGSTNLNFASFLTNYELDVAIEDEFIVERMADMYESDLTRATEIVLGRRSRVRRASAAGSDGRARRAMSGSAGRAAAGALGVGAAVGAALTGRRLLGPAETNLLWWLAAVLVLIAFVGVIWPPILAWPAAALAAWLALALAVRAYRQRRTRSRGRGEENRR